MTPTIGTLTPAGPVRLILTRAATCRVLLGLALFAALPAAVPPARADGEEPRSCFFERRPGDFPDSLLPLRLDSEHFRIHYTVTGRDSIRESPGLAYVEGIAQELERAFVTVHDDLALPVP